MISFLKADVIAACNQYGPLLHVPPGVDGIRCMIALASNESSLGANCGPRPEPFYQHSQQLLQMNLNTEYGEIAWSSHGPFQMMFVNFSVETQAAIAKGTVTLQDYAVEFVRFFNFYVIGVRKASTLAEIGEVWNLGHVGPDPVYVQKLEAAYAAA
jgi:hypothetical protein